MRRSHVDGTGPTERSRTFVPTSFPLTPKHNTAKTKRKRQNVNTSMAWRLTRWRQDGHIEEPDYSTQPAHTQPPEPKLVHTLPVGQVLELYRTMRTPEDRDEFMAHATHTLRHHTCSEARCLCGRLARLYDTVLDAEAVERNVTPWLPNPQHQVPGGAYSGKSQR
jgi:hypothetical protein